VEWATIGGAASSPALIRDVEQTLGFKCFSGYGLTECAPSLATAELKPDMQCAPEERYVLQAMTGYAYPGCELRVVDAEDKDVAHDGVTMGEIIARSDGVMAGYWQQPEATAEALRGGWFHTGDMAVIAENGYILIVDRKKDIIVSGGENVSSLDVEKVLAAHPGVYEAAVIPVADQKWGEVPKAVVVAKPGCKISEAELVEFCRSRLRRSHGGRILGQRSGADARAHCGVPRDELAACVLRFLPINSECNNQLYGVPPSPLSTGIIELGGKSRKIFEFKGLTWKIFRNKDLACQVWGSFEGRLG
jgi:acyl-CoA synthetase (AMP-forming)/AMP-acid ligase II